MILLDQSAAAAFDSFLAFDARVRAFDLADTDDTADFALLSEPERERVALAVTRRRRVGMDLESMLVERDLDLLIQEVMGVRPDADGFGAANVRRIRTLHRVRGAVPLPHSSTVFELAHWGERLPYCSDSISSFIDRRAGN